MDYPKEVKEAIEKVKTSDSHREGNPMYKKNINSSLYFGKFIEDGYVSFLRVIKVPEATEVIDAVTYNTWELHDECIYDVAIDELAHRKITAALKIIFPQD